MIIDERVSESGTRNQAREDAGRILARFVVAVATAALVSGLLWESTPTQLHGFTDVMGYPSFANFDYQRAFRGYHLTVYVFPAIALAVYAALAWRGPLKRPRRPGVYATVPLTDRLSVAEPRRSLDGLATVTPLNHALRLGFPAGLVALALTARSTVISRDLSSAGLIGAAVYVVVVLLAAGVLHVVRGMGTETAVAGYGKSLSAVNGIVGASGSLLGLWFISRHTVVLVAGVQPHWWRWFPFWVAALSVGLVCVWASFAHRRGRSAAGIEAWLLAVVTGSTLVFLGSALLPGALGSFAGFDDAQALVGGSLLSRGYFPWRDQFFIHGLLFDVLQGNLGFSLFGNTRWGGAAGTTVLLEPLDWVMMYLLALRIARSNWWLMAAFVAMSIGAAFDPLDARFILLAPTLVVLVEVIRRNSRRWTFALALLVVSQLILTPESVFFAPPLLLAMGGAELVHRDRGVVWWKALKQTTFGVIAACGLFACFAIYLLFNHALGSFVQWYVVFGPGHSAGAAIPPEFVTDRDWCEFFIAIGLILLSVWSAAYRIRGRRPWSSLDWLMVAAAGCAVLYGEKPLGRFDGGHVQQFVTVALPLAMVWFAKAMFALDRVHSRYVAGSLAVPSLRFPISAVAAVVIAFLVPSLSTAVRAIPGRLHAVSASAPSIPYVGYSGPGGVDPVLVSDVGKVLDTYAGQDGTVFDMTNSMGYLYYLLQRRPATKFVHVDMAITAYSQKLVVDDLRKSRPPVVIFESPPAIGLADWDGLSPSVRHYDIAQYVLDGWTPIVDTHGLLVLLRNDLLANSPALPALQLAPVSAGLYDVTAGCDWGYAANFLKSEPAGQMLKLGVSAAGAQQVDTFTGWAADPATHAGATTLVLAAAGREITSSSQTGTPRPDVGAAVGAIALNSGYATRVTVAAGSAVDVFELGSDRKLHQLLHSPTEPLVSGSVQLLNGKSVAIGGPGLGSVDSAVSQRINVQTVEIPAGVDLASYDLATLKFAGKLGSAFVTLTDSLGSVNDAITARTVGSTTNALKLRVGTCLQWHGYNARRLYLTQSGGSPITSVTLSGVR